MGITSDLLATARGRTDRPSRRVFAICIAPEKRRALYDEMHGVRRIVGSEYPMPYEFSSLKVAHALIGTIR